MTYSAETSANLGRLGAALLLTCGLLIVAVDSIFTHLIGAMVLFASGILVGLVITR